MKTTAKDVHKEMESDHRDARRDGDHNDEREKPREMPSFKYEQQRNQTNPYS